MNATTRALLALTIVAGGVGLAVAARADPPEPPRGRSHVGGCVREQAFRLGLDQIGVMPAAPVRACALTGRTSGMDRHRALLEVARRRAS